MSRISYSVSALLLLSSYPGIWLPPPLFTVLRVGGVAGGARGAVTGLVLAQERRAGTSLLLESGAVAALCMWDCLWNQLDALLWRWQEVDSRQKEKPFTSPPSVKFPVPNQWEVGAIESSIEYRQIKCFFLSLILENELY